MSTAGLDMNLQIVHTHLVTEHGFTAKEVAEDLSWFRTTYPHLSDLIHLEHIHDLAMESEDGGCA